MGVLSQIRWILHKDLLIEWRARSRVLALACFAATILLLFSFAIGPDTKALRLHAAGYLWLTILLSSTLLLNRSFRTETESGAIETLILAPTAPTALFYGKALANTLQLCALSVITALGVFGLCDATLQEPVWNLAIVVILGCAGLSAPGTLYAALTARISARQLLLPLLLFPLIVPALLAAVKATSLVMRGDPMDQIGSWATLLACFDLIYWSLCGILFERAIES